MRSFITLLLLLVKFFSLAQTTTRPLTRRVIVKTNVLSLIAQQPTISVEKAFSKTFSTELSFVQGQFNNILLTNHYDYQGFLIRAKNISRNFSANSIRTGGTLGLSYFSKRTDFQCRYRSDFKHPGVSVVENVFPIEAMVWCRVLNASTTV